MKQLKIEVPNGYEIDKEKSTFENIVFKEVKKGLPKSWYDLNYVSGYYVVGSEIKETQYTEKGSEIFKEVFPTRKEAEAMLAMAQLCQLRDAYNGEPFDEWHNLTSDKEKYVIVIYRNKIIGDIFYFANAPMSFKTEELRDEFLSNFKELLEIAKPFL